MQDISISSSFNINGRRKGRTGNFLYKPQGSNKNIKYPAPRNNENLIKYEIWAISSLYREASGDSRVRGQEDLAV